MLELEADDGTIERSARECPYVPLSLSNQILSGVVTTMLNEPSRAFAPMLFESLYANSPSDVRSARLSRAIQASNSKRVNEALERAIKANARSASSGT